MIEVVVSHHDVADRLVGNQLADLCEHRQGALLVERRLDHRDEIAEFDRQAVVAPACDEPDSVGQLLRFRAHGRRGGRSHRIRHGHRRNGDVRLDVRHRDLHRVVGHGQPRIALVNVERGGEFHAAEILVVRVAQLVQHVAVYRVRNPRVHHREEVLVIERADHAVLSHRRELDELRPSVRGHGAGRASERQRDGRRIACLHRRLEEPVRRQQDVQLPELRYGDPGEVQTRLRLRHGALHVPRVIAVDEEHLLLLSLQRRAAAAARRIVSLSAREFLARRSVFIIDGAHVARHFEPRPVVLRTRSSDPRRHSSLSR